MTAQVTDTVSRIRKLLTKVLRSCGRSRNEIAEIFELLETLEQDRVDPGAGARPRQKSSITGYRIEHFQGEDVLAELREGMPHPYRCRREIYDAAAKALGWAKEGFYFEDIYDRVAKELKQNPPDYVVRMCLRFWQKCDEPILKRLHRKYRPIEPRWFEGHAKHRWQKLKDKTQQNLKN